MDAPTATAKRKRSSSAAPAAVGVDDVSDAEVEEFYAILRRMRDASRRLVSGGVAAARARAPAPAPAPRAPAWCPSFSWEDFAPPAPTTPPPAPQQQQQQQLLPADERVAENASPPRRPVPRGLDLNAEPEPEVHA